MITSSSPVPVGPSAELSKPPFLAELQEGDVIEVVETRFLVSEHRLRGRLANPNGWISLRNTETGFSWVEHESIFRDFDTNMSRALESLSHETLGSGMEAELREEVRDRLKGDLLYLAALRKQAKSGFSALPSFESRDGKTWALAGPGHDDWRRVAGNTTWEVPCKEVTGQLRRVMLGAVIAERAYALPLVDSYAEQRTVYQGPYKAFFDCFWYAKEHVLKNIGGASGLPSMAGSASQSSEAPHGSWSKEEIMQWLDFYARVSANTRISQADAYFGHALFGMCLRRLIRRYELALSFEKSMGSDSSSSGSSISAAVEKARFENFIEMLANPSNDDITLNEIVDLSGIVIAAARRQVEAVFGQGLRDELSKAVSRANAEIEREGADAETSPLEKHAALQLQAANAGELRMLSTSPEAKDWIMWDAIVFGAFLQDAEDTMLKNIWLRSS